MIFVGCANACCKSAWRCLATVSGSFQWPSTWLCARASIDRAIDSRLVMNESRTRRATHCIERVGLGGRCVAVGNGATDTSAALPGRKSGVFFDQYRFRGESLVFDDFLEPSRV